MSFWESGVSWDESCRCQKHPQYLGKRKIQTTTKVSEEREGLMRDVERCLKCKKIVRLGRVI